MAVKVGNLMVGQTPDEQRKLERRRFLARQRRKLTISERLAKKEEEQKEKARLEQPCFQELME